MANQGEQVQDNTSKNAGVSRAAFLNLIAGAGCFGAGTLAGKFFFGTSDSSAGSQGGSSEGSSPEGSTPSGEGATADPEKVYNFDNAAAGEELLQVGQISGGNSESDDEEEEQPFEDYWCVREDDAGDMNIFGLLFRPEGEGPFPTVICSHGITGMCWNFFGYAEYLQQAGYMVYAFDFCGGNYNDNAQSDGEFIDMTINSEMADLKAVLEEVRNMDDVDTDRIYLMGHSQGGLVTSLVAGDEIDKLKGIVLIAPGFELVDMVHEKFPNRADIPEMFDMFNTFKVGQAYGVSLWDLNWEPVIARFTKPVLLLHGTQDQVINYTYSVTAADNYEDPQLELFPRAAHWLYDADFDRSCELILAFLEKN